MTPARAYVTFISLAMLMPGLLSPTYAQFNLVPNPSFETLSVCPTGFGGAGPSVAPPWAAPTLGTPDIYNVCATPQSGMDVPDNFFGFQDPVTGDGYAGIYTRISGTYYREYMMAPLDQPLLAGQEYCVSFYVSLAEDACGIERIGAFFSNDAIDIDILTALGYTPQVESSGSFLSDQEDWMLITGCFIATGGESYITIGCFHDDPSTPVDPACNPFLISYYYIDDVSVTCEQEEIDIELGGPVTACFEYEIDPGIPDLFYHWEDGSEGTTLVVTESGTYALTVTNGCQYGIDSIDVTILGNHPPVDIPQSQIELCIGDSYSVELDPGLAAYTWQDGSHASEYVITQPGIYSVTLDDGCSVSTDEIEVIVVEPIEPISLGEIPYLCFESTIEFAFDPDLGHFTWQDGSTESDYIVIEPGYYAVTISNACNAVSADATITELDAPEIEIGADQLLLCPGEIIELVFDPDLGDFLWQDGSVSNEYTISTSGTYSVFVTNACGTGSDQVVVSTADTPAVDFGHDSTLCAGQQLLLHAGGLSGTYEWQDGSANDTFIVSSPGEYTLTLSNACGVAADTINVEYAPPVNFPALGSDIMLCPGESVVFQLNDPNALFIWQDGSTADSLFVTSAGEYFVTAYNICGTLSDTVLVTVNAQPPVVELAGDVLLCQGQTIVIDAGVSGVDYLWNDNSTGASVLVSSPGVYSITVSNSCGSDVDSITVIDGGPVPVVDLGSDLTFCEGDTIELVPSFAAVDQWLWSTGATSTSIEITTSGTTSVIVSNSCGTHYDTINATLLPATPTFSLGNDTAVCANEIVTLSVNVPDVNITWSDGSSHPDLTVSTAGQYFATISNTCGSFADTISIGQLPPIPPLDLGDDQSLCPGELFVIDPGILDVDYLWHDGSTNSTFSTTQPGAIILTISNACGSTTDELIITESTEGPQIYLGPDITGCVGESITIQSGISGVDYLWQDGSTNSSFIANVSGQVILSVSNNCGMDADTLFVELSGLPPVVELGADTLLCDNATLDLSVTHEPGTVITWQDGSTSATFEVIQPGQYAVSAMNACGEANDVIVVDYAFSPQPFSLGPDTALCVGESLLLTAPVTTDIIQWQDGSSAPAFIADQTQVYALQISNQCGVVSDELQLTLIDETFSIELDTAMAWCPGQVIEVDVQQPFVATYLWSTGATTPVISITEPGSYAISIQTHCASADDVFDVVLDDACFPKTTYYIPNIFSPNGDGINDVFTIRFNDDAEVLSMQGAIYDRWGNLLFASTDNPFTWDGKRNGQVMNPAVFVYDFQFTFMRNGVPTIEKVTGDVTLLK